jgi:hypothetical protein
VRLPLALQTQLEVRSRHRGQVGVRLCQPAPQEDSVLEARSPLLGRPPGPICSTISSGSITRLYRLYDLHDWWREDALAFNLIEDLLQTFYMQVPLGRAGSRRADTLTNFVIGPKYDQDL